MEFKLNKIDMDIINRMQEETKDDKVHAGKGITVKRDLKDDKNDNSRKKNKKNKEELKRYITIDGVKYSKSQVRVNVEKQEKINAESLKGSVLDVKK